MSFNRNPRPDPMPRVRSSSTRCARRKSSGEPCDVRVAPMRVVRGVERRRRGRGAVECGATVRARIRANRPLFAPYFDMDLHVYVCTVCPRSIYTYSGPSASNRARARHPSTRTGRAARANGDIHYVLTFSRAVSPRRARETPRERDARAGDIHHVGALSPRARRSRTSGVDVVRRVDARVFSRAIDLARASRDVLRASARRRDARQAVRQGQATAATAARPTRAGRAGRAGTRADARVESGRVAARGGVVVGGV